MAAVSGRYKRNRHILGEPLSEVEIQTLQEKDVQAPQTRGLSQPCAVCAGLERGGRSVEDISGILRVTVPPVYKCARAWRERGLMGMLSGHVCGPPRKLTVELLDVAEQIARQVHELHPEAPTFSVDRLSVGLRARGLSFKRNRLTLEKNATPSDSRACKRA